MLLVFRRLLPVLSCLLITACVTFAAEQPPQLKLPGNVAPTGYRITLKLDPAQTTFSGHIEIQVNVKQPVKTIWLNATNIAISEAKLSKAGIGLAPQIVAGGTDFVGLRFDSVQPGTATIRISYTGHLRLQDSSGVFRMEEDGIKYIYTQFEETDARAAFPCFDEPSYKVPWQLTLEVPKGEDAVSNTPIEKQESNGDSKVLHFKETKPLPSYLVAFAVGQFDFVPAGFAGKNHVPIRIVTPKGHAKEAKYAAEVTATILTRLENYFGIPYPYEKADQVAIPVTYGFGAMENAGMVTYEQNVLLADPDRDTAKRQRLCASDEAHELAHQWFGDLVTTAWWNDIWLNEAFATWMEQKIIAEWKPEWQTRVADVADKLGAEAEDTLTSARKIRQEIKTKDDISNAFDGITYQKGAAVIGMFENWMGAPAFREGVQSYLRKYAFGNANATEFLAAISAKTNKSVTEPFSSFLNQAGVPLVSVGLDCNGKSPVLHLEQERSLPLHTTTVQKEMWQIPVCVRYGNAADDESACTLMTDPESDWKLKGNGCPAWVDANANALGYYRIVYQGNLLSELTEGDVQHRLSAAERVDLLGNAQALSGTGKMTNAEMLSLVPRFHDDPSWYVVRRAVNVALSPREHLVPEDLWANYQRFIRQSFGEQARELGWIEKPGETNDARWLRPTLVPFVATVGGDEELAKEARQLTEKWLADQNAVPADEVEAVLETAAYYGDKALFDRFLGQLKTARDRQERRYLLGAMTSFRDPAAIQAGMEAVLHGTIPFIEGERLLFAGQQEPQTRKLAFNFMKEHIEELAAKRPSGGGDDAGAAFVRVGASFCDAQSEEQLKSFFEPEVGKFTGAPRMLEQTLGRINSCIASRSAQEPSVEKFLRGY
jgi:cytosol alanyl aminopeptidase